MKKFVAFVIIVILAVLVAGLYGIAHNQISYTISPEYFTKFKFRQFGFADTRLPERVRASMVGFLASWWMGIPIGLLIGAVGFVHREHRRMLRSSLWAILAAAGFTLLFGLCGLVYGYIQTRQTEMAEFRGWHIPAEVTELRRFICVGYMHNSSYLGGAIAVFIAWGVHFLIRTRSVLPETSNSRPDHRSHRGRQ